MENLKYLGEMLARMQNQIATDYVHFKAVFDILVEKGIVTEKEYSEKFKMLYDEQSAKIHDYIEKGELDD